MEKPPKFVEKGNLEVLLFTLQSRMRANNQKPYTPKEGKMISDINKAWERLEKAEHERYSIFLSSLIYFIIIDIIQQIALLLINYLND